jgi:hypothetical protein
MSPPSGGVLRFGGHGFEQLPEFAGQRVALPGGVVEDDLGHAARFFHDSFDVGSRFREFVVPLRDRQPAANSRSAARSRLPAFWP